MADRRTKMENSGRTWGLLAGLAIALAGSIGILTGRLPARMSGLVAVLAIAVIVGTRKWASSAARR
jgi:hypothetical protein